MFKFFFQWSYGSHKKIPDNSGQAIHLCEKYFSCSFHIIVIVGFCNMDIVRGSYLLAENNTLDSFICEKIISHPQVVLLPLK